MIGVIESRRLPCGWEAQLVGYELIEDAVAGVGGSRVGLAANAVAADENVQPSIVVVIPKPGRKTLAWFGNARLRGHVGKVNSGRLIGRAAAVIVQQYVVTR